MDLNFVQIDGSSFAKRRKFGNGACVRCHERKVKCGKIDSVANTGSDS